MTEIAPFSLTPATALSRPAALAEASIPPPLDLPVVAVPVAHRPALLLVTAENLHPESGFGQTSGFSGVLVVSGAATSGDRSRAFVAGAAADTGRGAAFASGDPIRVPCCAGGGHSSAPCG